MNKPIKTVRVDELTKGAMKDFGQVWVFDCPECGQTIRCLQNCEDYRVCECGYTWHIELYATGVKDASDR